MRDKTCGEFVQALAAYRRHARETFSVDLRVVRTDNDPCFTDVHSRTHGNVRELETFLDSLLRTIRMRSSRKSRLQIIDLFILNKLIIKAETTTMVLRKY